MTSTRLPGKVLAPCLGKPMLELMVERVRCVPSLDGIIIATTINRADDTIAELAERLGLDCWRGSEEDVLNRVLDAARAFDVDVIVELTGDCPLIDPMIVELVIEEYRRAGMDYVSNVLTRGYPIGMDTEVYATPVLEDVARRTADPVDHEHVSVYIYQHPEIYSLGNVAAPSSLERPKLRLTLDTPEDLQVISSLFEALYPANPEFSLADMLAFLDQHPKIAAINAHVKHRYVRSA